MRNPIFFGLCALLFLHAFTALVYAMDKRRAQRGQRRIPEVWLLFWTLLGGGGALYGIFRVRHKNRKASFLLWAIPAAVLSLLWQLWLLRRIF